MKVTFEKLIACLNCLTMIGDSENGAWYGIARNKQRINSAIKDYRIEYDEAIRNIRKRLAKKDEEGNVLLDSKNNVIFAENEEEAIKMISELNSHEIEIDFYKIPQSQFGNTMNANLIEPLLDLIIEE